MYFQSISASCQVGSNRERSSRCSNRRKSGPPVPFSVGDRRIYRRPPASERPRFSASKKAIGQSQAIFRRWFESRQRSNKQEFSSSEMTRWAVSAFGWQRRQESGDRRFVCAAGASFLDEKGRRPVSTFTLRKIRRHLIKPNGLAAGVKSSPAMLEFVEPRWTPRINSPNLTSRSVSIRGRDPLPPNVSACVRAHDETNIGRLRVHRV
jgi:hypothetical protein